VGGPGDIGTDRRVASTIRASDLEDIGFLGRRGEVLDSWLTRAVQGNTLESRLLLEPAVMRAPRQGAGQSISKRSVHTEMRV